ncbi:MAG TPA: ABC transporter substrate-binding protein [Gammaproteobacteria bacterium]|nr:ABC transporter substrate-binding protein [Gammaproteobacteria bacterium]
MKIIQSGIQGLLLLVSLLLFSLQSLANENEAVAVVEKLHDKLLHVMQNGESLGFQGRYDVLEPVIESGFDTPLISRVILSRYWGELSDEKQQDFIDLFNRLSTATYASRFNSFSGESFRTIGVDTLKKGRLLVKTELVRPDDDNVKLEYIVQENAGTWYIISVIADGVNDLALKRAEYAAIITDRGFESLVGEIQNKIRDLETDTAN